jgi:predicted alpha/beta superfamily hydrolase
MNAYRRQLVVHYPAGAGRIVLRTALDWDRDVEPDATADDGRSWIFHLESREPFIYFKPCLRERDELRWSVGSNLLVLMTLQGTREIYPFFRSAPHGRFTAPIELDSSALGRRHTIRVYLPPGYDENTLKRYPVLYMQDGKNLFFPQESFQGHEWGVDESLQLLDTMNAVDKVIVVGIHSEDRLAEYSKPGYEAYGRSVVQEIRPLINARGRTLPGSAETGVMGSSLGGVVSFYMAWQWPEVFGCAACLSSAFSAHDDLMERVLSEPRCPSRFYLDSGWPGDNYEVTLAMAAAFTDRGYVYGRDFLHFSFPLAEHDERAWGRRLHLPLQFFTGKVATAARGRLV